MHSSSPRRGAVNDHPQTFVQATYTFAAREHKEKRLCVLCVHLQRSSSVVVNRAATPRSAMFLHSDDRRDTCPACAIYTPVDAATANPPLPSLLCPRKKIIRKS